MQERTGFLEDLRRANLNTGFIPVLTMGSCASVAGSSPTGEQLAESMSLPTLQGGTSGSSPTGEQLAQSMSPPTLQGGSFQDYHNGLKHLSGIQPATFTRCPISILFPIDHNCSLLGMPAADLSDKFLIERKHSRFLPFFVCCCLFTLFAMLIFF